MYSVETVGFPKGGNLGFNKDLALSGWFDSKLAQKIPFEDFWKLQQKVMAEPHAKVIVSDNHGSVGGVVLTEGIDAQVGPCLMVFHQFLKKEARGSALLWRKVIRQSMDVARTNGYRFLVWSHRDETTGRVYITHKEV